MEGREGSVEVVTGAMIFDERGRLLLCRSPKWKGYVIPGGHVEYGESMFDASKREVKEETNLDVDDVRLLRVGELIFPSDFRWKVHFVFLHFSCRAKNGGAVRLNDELSSFLWVTPREALVLDLSKGVRESIEEYMRKNPG